MAFIAAILVAASAGIVPAPGAVPVPSVPEGLRIIETSDRRVELDWDDAADESWRYQVYRDGVIVANGLLASAYSDTAVTNGRAYNYRVSTSSGSVYSPWTAAVAATPAPITPTVPSGLRVAKVSNGRVELDWEDTSGRFGRYQVYRDGDLLANGLTGSAFIDDDVTNGRTYSYRVSTGASSTYSAWSPAVTATPAPLKPPAPTGIKVVRAFDGQVELDWTDSAGAIDHYQVYRDRSMIADGPSASRFVDTTAANGRTYTYRVGARADGAYSEWSEGVSASPAAPSAGAPVPPGGLRVASAAAGRIEIEWADSPPGLGRYQVYRDGFLVSDGLAESRYVDTDVERGGTFEYRVSVGVAPAMSGLAAPVSATVGPAPAPELSAPATPVVPEGLRVVSASGGAVKLDWSDVADLSGLSYQVYRDRVLIARNVEESEFVDTDVFAGDTYSYRVSTGGEFDFSEWTAPVLVTLTGGGSGSAPSAPTTSATPFFVGDRVSKFNVQVSGRTHGSGATDVPDPAGSGRSVIRLRAVEQDASGGVVRAQAVGPSNLQAGNEYWDVAGYYVPANFPSVPAWQAVLSIYGPPYSGSPNNIIGIHGNTVDIQWSVNGTRLWKATLAKGQWHNLFRRYRLAADGSGWMELYHSVGNQPLQQVTFSNGQKRITGATLDSAHNGGNNNFRISNYRKAGMPGFGDNSIYYRGVAQWHGAATLADVSARYFGG